MLNSRNCSQSEGVDKKPYLQNICASQPCTLQKTKRVIVSISYIVYMFLCLTGLHNHLKPLAYD